MSLLSLFRKNKQEAAAEDSTFYSRAESDSQTVRPRKRKTTSRSGDVDSNAPVDPVLPEKKRARRRLVGAVALVLAVVIGLPMVLDSEPKPLADDVSIEIPSKDKPASPSARSRADAPAGGATAGAGVGGAAGVASGGSRVPAAAALDQKEEMVEPAPVPAAPAKSGSSPPQTKSHDTAHDTAHDSAHDSAHGAARDAAAAKSPEKPVEKSADKASETAKADADGKHAKFTVQVAAFASMDKVNELRGKLKSAGIASYTQKVATESGERIRIRVGPLNSRQDADRMRARLSALGLSGTLVPAPS